MRLMLGTVRMTGHYMKRAGSEFWTLCAGFSAMGRMVTVNDDDDINSDLSRPTTQILYRLLANFECIEPLRQEVDAVIREEGWTKAGIDKMHNIDSLLRETQRVDNFTACSSDFSPASFKKMKRFIQTRMNSTDFASRRFARARGIQRQADIKPSLSPTNICPLDRGDTHVNEVKALLAHIFVIYDIKFAEGHGVPRELFLSGLRYPGKAKVMFRAWRK